ncbi:hypothetical protein XH83_27725 [Bradyrhizobium sp. CCBAU 53351]|nr:hypothetical protein XH83_27725 [Bradyrhizobium sp. CCBAU 53351]
MNLDTAPDFESLTHAPAPASKAKKRRGPKLRPVNLTKRKQDAEHQAKVARAEESRQADLASATSPALRRLIEMGEPTDWAGNPIEAPRRNIGSEQGVLVLKRVMLAATIHPDDRDRFTDAQLAQVIDDSTEEVALEADFYRHVDRIPDSIHRHMLAFQTESQEKAQAQFEAKKQKNADKQQRRAERHMKGLAKQGTKVEAEAVVVDEAEKAAARKKAEEFAAKAREQAAESADRMEHGFLLAKPGVYAGDHYDPFHEFLGKGVLRSHLSPSFARFAQIVPRRGRIRAGYDKGALFSTATKLIALDCPYVELDTTRHCCIVVEFDTVWASAAAFRLALLQHLPAQMLPNLIVGRITRSGQFARPHCIWFLNPYVVDPKDGTVRDACVWNEPYRETTDPTTGEVKIYGDKRCRKGPIEKYHAVQRGLVARLLPLGADPGCWNIFKPKNPLSPFWTTLLANEDHWSELDDFIAIPKFSMKVDEADLARRGAEMRADAAKNDGEILTPSNLMWATIGVTIEPLVAKMLRIRDLSFLDAARDGVETLTQWFDDRIRPNVEAEITASASLDRVLEGRCAFAARYCIDKLNRSRSRIAINRGRDDDLKVVPILDADGNERLMTPEERIKKRGVRSGATRSAVALWKMCEQLSVTGLVADEMTARKTEIIKGLDFVGKSFAYDNWDRAIDLIFNSPAPVPRPRASRSRDSANMYKDKKHTLSPDQTIEHSSSTLTTGAFEAFPAPANPVQSIEPPWLDPVDGPSEAKSLDHRRSAMPAALGNMLCDAVVCPDAEPVGS